MVNLPFKEAQEEHLVEFRFKSVLYFQKDGRYSEQSAFYWCSYCYGYSVLMLVPLCFALTVHSFTQKQNKYTFCTNNAFHFIHITRQFLLLTCTSWEPDSKPVITVLYMHNGPARLPFLATLYHRLQQWHQFYNSVKWKQWSRKHFECTLRNSHKVAPYSCS